MKTKHDFETQRIVKAIEGMDVIHKVYNKRHRIIKRDNNTVTFQNGVRITVTRLIREYLKINHPNKQKYIYN